MSQAPMRVDRLQAQTNKRKRSTSRTAPALQVVAGGQTLSEQQLTDRLLALLSGVEAAPEALSLEGALRRPPPAAQQDDDSRLPLTW